MSEMLTAASLIVFAAWTWLVLFRGRFWLADERLPPVPAPLASWPSVTAVVPARDEAATVGETVASLLAQDYPGKLDIVVVDDGSRDGTPRVAMAAAKGSARRLQVVAAPPLPAGWTGKLWALAAGTGAAAAKPRYLWFTDADIVHGAEVLRGLVAKAETGRHDLVSLMVRLHCASPAERLLIPAFVFFFQKLYPFAWVNDARRSVAGGAGGCMLVRREALHRIGGLGAIRNALIDDCALAAALKRRGSIWLGHGAASWSRRRYGRLREIWRMVARTAYAQLRHSPLLLAGTVAGMALLYAGPPILALAGLVSGALPAAILAGAAWGLMSLAYRPTGRLLGRPAPAVLLLPVAALLFTAMTVDSACRHWRGRGGSWKGRTYPAMQRG